MMLSDPSGKYRPFTLYNDLPDRTWPGRRTTTAPVWLSTDLRDGNQSLIDPMDVEKKSRMWDLLVRTGFKEIEAGFPSASQTDFDFIRLLIEDGRIPGDVTVQVLTQAREDLIVRTFESLKGAKRAIVHVYNATQPLFRRVVFNMEKHETIALAVAAARCVLEESRKYPDTEWTFEYSPETFSCTEPELAVEICAAVLDVWRPTPARKAILNLPATVESAGPNVYADQIEWFCRNVPYRDSVVISVHPHNDRGTGVAAAELAVQAGADRVEGCLFGHGERTGNVDLVTLAMNLYSQGVDPKLDFSDMRATVRTVEHCTGITVHPRHPYAGDLVFTAFSGSHQDAIKKGFAAHARRNDGVWEMPYLPIDPADIGCTYEAVIRVNSQSGKGGVAWVLEQDKGLQLPRRLQIDLSRRVQEEADRTSRELTAADIWGIFSQAYGLAGPERFRLLDYTTAISGRSAHPPRFDGTLEIDGQTRRVSGKGNGLISAALDALKDACGLTLDVVDYHEHALKHGADAQAAAYVECRDAEGRTVWGVGIDTDIATASVKAILAAANASGG